MPRQNRTEYQRIRQQSMQHVIDTLESTVSVLLPRDVNQICVIDDQVPYDTDVDKFIEDIAVLQDCANAVTSIAIGDAAVCYGDVDSVVDLLPKRNNTYPIQTCLRAGSLVITLLKIVERQPYLDVYVVLPYLDILHRITPSDVVVDIHTLDVDYHYDLHILLRMPPAFRCIYAMQQICNLLLLNYCRMDSGPTTPAESMDLLEGYTELQAIIRIWTNEIVPRRARITEDVTLVNRFDSYIRQQPNIPYTPTYRSRRIQLDIKRED